MPIFIQTHINIPTPTHIGIIALKYAYIYNIQFYREILKYIIMTFSNTRYSILS